MSENKSKYSLLEPSDLVIYNNPLGYGTKEIGVILSLNNDNDWWGGGYYNIFWNTADLYRNKSQKQVSYCEMDRWQRSGAAKIFSATNNKQ